MRVDTAWEDGIIGCTRKQSRKSSELQKTRLGRSDKSISLMSEGSIENLTILICNQQRLNN